MLVNNYAHRLSGLGEMSWEDWCASAWGKDPAILTKCLSKPWGFASAAPWTDVGAFQRGIPKASIVTDVLNTAGGLVGGQGATGSGGPFVGVDGTIFGLPPMVVYVGGALAAAGVVAVLIKKKKKGGSLAGWRRRRRRRSRR